MEKITVCPACNSTKFEPYLQTMDYFFSQKEFSISKCQACAFLYTNPRPVESSASGYYHSEEYISHSNSDKGLVNRVYKIVRNYSLNKKSDLVKRYFATGKVLDIGCGTGHFLHHLSSSFEVMGVEPGEAARQYATDQFNLTVNPDLFSLNDAKADFDVISMWHVLEHVYPLDDYIKKIRQLLNPKGILIIAVPNPASADATYYNKFWAAYDLPRHLYHFTQNTITELLLKHHFELVEVKPMKFDAYYVSLLSEKYKHGKNKFLNAFIRGLKSNIWARKHQNNYSSLIYIFKPKIS